MLPPLINMGGWVQGSVAGKGSLCLFMCWSSSSFGTGPPTKLGLPGSLWRLSDVQRREAVGGALSPLTVAPACLLDFLAELSCQG